MRVFFLRNEEQFPVACVASEKVNRDGQDVVVFAVSTWNPKDGFDRQRGRAVAEGRLQKGRLNGLIPLAGEKVKTRLLQAIAEDEVIPQRARDAAVVWLKQQQQ